MLYGVEKELKLDLHGDHIQTQSKFRFLKVGMCMIRKYEYTILGIIYFIIVFFNDYITIRFGADILIHAAIVIILFLSYREKDRFDKGNYWMIYCISFFLKICMLVIQSIYINYKYNIKIYMITEVFCSIVIILCEICLNGHMKDIERQSYNDKGIKNRYIENYFKNKYEDYKLISPIIRFNKKNNIDKNMKRAFISGIQTIIITLSVIVIYVMKFLNKNIFHEIKIFIAVMIFLLIINFIVLVKGMNSKLIISTYTCISLGILYIGEVLYWFKMDDIRMLIWSFSMLFLIPLINEKNDIAKKIGANSI